MHSVRLRENQAAPGRGDMPNDVANRLVRKLGLLQTPSTERMKEFARRARELQDQGHTFDQAAIRAASEKFTAEFKANNYDYKGESMEALLADIENL
jgi:hypothetical protein